MRSGKAARTEGAGGGLLRGIADVVSLVLLVFGTLAAVTAGFFLCRISFLLGLAVMTVGMAVVLAAVTALGKAP